MFGFLSCLLRVSFVNLVFPFQAAFCITNIARLYPKKIANDVKFPLITSHNPGAVKLVAERNEIEEVNKSFHSYLKQFRNKFAFLPLRWR